MAWEVAIVSPIWQSGRACLTRLTLSNRFAALEYKARPSCPFPPHGCPPATSINTISRRPPSSVCTNTAHTASTTSMQRLARWVASSLSPSPMPQVMEGSDSGTPVAESTCAEEFAASNVSGVSRTLSRSVCPQGWSKSASALEQPHTPHAPAQTQLLHVSPPPGRRPKIPADDTAIERNAAVLAELGIKVRDFAYESKLPPIRSVPYVPVQTIRPRASPLKRKRDDEEPEDDYEGQTLYFDAERGGTTLGRRPVKKPRPVERVPTEPADIGEPPAPTAFSSQPTRTYAYADLSSFVHRRRPAFPNSVRPRTPTRVASPTAGTPVAGPSRQPADVAPSQGESQGESQGTSQETEGWVVTPLATPESSMRAHVEVSSTLPASQLDTPSRLPPPEDVTYSQLGFTPDNSPSQAVRLGSPSASPASPIRPLTFTPTSGTHSGSSQPPASPSPARQRAPALAPVPAPVPVPAPAPARISTRRATRQHAAAEAASATTRTQRYNLRDRVPMRGGAVAAKLRGVRAMSSRQEATGKHPSPVKKGKAPQSSPPKRGATGSSPPKRGTASTSPSKRGAKASPPKRTTRRTAKQALLD